MAAEIKNVNDEILAAIAAAVACLEARPGHRLVVTSMRRVAQSAPVWNATGRIERLMLFNRHV